MPSPGQVHNSVLFPVGLHTSTGWQMRSLVKEAPSTSQETVTLQVGVTGVQVAAFAVVEKVPTVQDRQMRSW